MRRSRVHGGPDALGVPRWDFSTNANACGPEPAALAAIRASDLARYPDPGYTALRAELARRHRCTPRRVVVGASASEWILRITGWLARVAPEAAVHAPQPGYADYAHAAGALGLRLVAASRQARLVWHTEPSSPFGTSSPPPATDADALLVIDRAYEPLRLEGDAPPAPPAAWQLWSPNKALGLSGVRGAYAIAPAGAEAIADELDALAPSWPLGADGVALLHAWTQAPTQAWLTASLATLRTWKREQLSLCAELGWSCAPSATPFFVADWRDAPGRVAPVQALAALRERGIKLRDAGSFGLPGRVRLSVQPPAAQRALREAWRSLRNELAKPAR
ncbi:MAG TPA: aminotransferase class I/II-fold pyridoxal phosphate-dependent enzyme [Methylibium sp.]|uniref:aminotransferase class I/II-fold pyridoxal phosphate-dependent enzyme n=1 Tax=Methylibium sp. TaxID=2067992 RepID=UPI002DBEFCF7|nr:aminotransferase class I/II-fold pyridoxal phosphate-dependent enzyme [Methylibium sp.]HEU4459896.1 aminotransferase class I/II-fold pyridoxal phosphate-dependent enzyme [Methylibium sp.]